jgi:RNA-directed DNA polymerase
VIELWSARDSFVLKALTIVLADAVDVSDRCTHIRSNRSSKGAVKQLAAALPDYRFVFRTDVKSFYTSIDHWVLYEQLCERLHDKGIRRLLWQYLKRCVEHGSVFRDVEKGISMG